MKVTIEDYEVIDRLSTDRRWRQRFDSLAYQNKQVEAARMEVVYVLDDMATARRLQVRKVRIFRAAQPARGEK